ncbi:MAG: hypothetical protein LBH06_01505 [Rikenellaceae bacterium]|jgi:hypothetical protein|nr:hypothetical protein [Rikenellaceae bacterium]
MEKQKRTKFSGTVFFRDKQIIVNLFVIQFEDDNCRIAYCPALNVYGYGKSEEEARSSFEVNLAEFFDYAIKKKTLECELESLGWSASKGKKFTSPDFSSLLQSNKQLKNIMNTRNFSKIDRSFTLPVAN